ncbi:unannotated protein [freshwater metagenome]|uniref:Unannotated protein n=1 Tax=freshwater metagenome TaxID=449393 RepID=A0A6J7JWS0_9ZZZZ
MRSTYPPMAATDTASGEMRADHVMRRDESKKFAQTTKTPKKAPIADFLPPKRAEIPITSGAIRSARRTMWSAIRLS